MTGNHVGCNSPRGFKSLPFRHYLALALTSVFILACAPAQYLGRQEDDIVYIIASHALAQGSYRMITSPAHIPLTMMLPGFPILLLPITWLCGERYWTYQLFCTLILAASPWVLWAWFLRNMEQTQALLTALLFGLSPLALSQAGTVMTECVYAAAVVPFLFFLETSRIKSGLMLLFLTQLRPGALSLAPAALAGSLWKRRWKDAAFIGLPGAMGMLLWFRWSNQVSSGMQKIQELQIFYAGRPWSDALKVAADNSLYYLSSWGSCYLPLWLAQGPAALVLGMLLMSLSLAGIAGILRKDPANPGALMLLGGLGMHAVWSWQYERYLICLLPWLLWTAAKALGKRATWIFSALLAAQVVFQSRLWLGRTAWSKPELLETYAWLKLHSGPSDILASLAFARDGFYAVRPALPLPGADGPDDFERILKRAKVKFILWQEGLGIGLSLQERSANYRLVARSAAFLEDRRRYGLIYENPGEHSRVYALKPQ